MSPPGYTPVARVGRVVLASLAVNALLAWLVIVGIYTFLERVWRGLSGRFLPGETLEAHWSQLEMLRRVQGVAWLVTAAVFLWWLHRAYRNLRALGAEDLGFTPRSALSAFFVPVLNAIVPFRVVRELWNASDPSAAPPAVERARSTSPWVGWWWGVFLASVALDPSVFRLVSHAMERFTVGSTVVLVLAQLLEMAAAILAMVVVWTVSQGQEEIAERGESA